MFFIKHFYINKLFLLFKMNIIIITKLFTIILLSSFMISVSGEIFYRDWGGNIGSGNPALSSFFLLCGSINCGRG
uniref:Uncharacterized protein n=1 Tax=Strongyloides papillosus TaxID=174720 RepID=A0A0N5BSG9_STREA